MRARPRWRVHRSILRCTTGAVEHQPLVEWTDRVRAWSYATLAMLRELAARDGTGIVLRAGVDASRSTISFGILDDDLWTIGTSVGVDTRLDPSFPGNAVFVTGGWTGMHFRTLPDRVNRLTGDARGYLRTVRIEKNGKVIAGWMRVAPSPRRDALRGRCSRFADTRSAGGRSRTGSPTQRFGSSTPRPPSRRK